MVRSGKLLLILLSAAALVACSATAEPPVTPGPTTVETTTCPDGLTESLEAHLSGRAIGDRLPVSVTVTAFPEKFSFASDLVTSMSSCLFSIETLFEGGDLMGQLFGIAEGHDRAIAAVTDAGWEQPFPDAAPEVWQDPSTPEDSVSIDPRGNPERPVLGFPAWAEFLGPDEVLLSSGIAS